MNRPKGYLEDDLVSLNPRPRISTGYFGFAESYTVLGLDNLANVNNVILQKIFLLRLFLKMNCLSCFSSSFFLSTF